MKDKILMVVFVLVLGSILTTALVAVNFYTAGGIFALAKDVRDPVGGQNRSMTPALSVRSLFGNAALPKRSDVIQ